MALEAVILSEDPLTSYNYCKQYNSTNNLYNLISGSSFYDYTNYPISSKLEHQSSYEFDHAMFFDSNINITNYCDNTSSSQVTDDHNINTINNDVINHHSWDNQHYFSVEAAPLPPPPPPPPPGSGGGERRKRRRRSCKNREEVEQQRMTHIAVERNRRKQMNEYLAVIRSLMPASYAQRGDQASIVGGAINYVKELEQQLQNLQAQKNTNQQQQQQCSPKQPSTEQATNNMEDIISCSDKKKNHVSSIFGDFFTFPQYSNRSMSDSSSDQNINEEMTIMKGSKREEAAGEIEVNMADSHANVRILTKKQPKQLLRLVTAFQGLRLTILHLNVTSFDSDVLYSFSLKVEEGSQFNSIDDIADATNHILKQIQGEVDILL